MLNERSAPNNPSARAVAWKVAALLALGGILLLWGATADSVATNTCDDGCSPALGGWGEDPDAWQWAFQRVVAYAGIAVSLAAVGVGLAGARGLSIGLGILAVTLFVVWYPMAEKGRFGPPPIFSSAPEIYSAARGPGG